MPRIKPYQSQIGAPGPAQGRNPTAEDFGAPIAQGLQTLGQGAGALAQGLEEHAGRIEVSDLQAKSAEKAAYWTQDLQERIRTADPGDKNFVENFRNDFQKDMDTVSDEITTQAGRKFFDSTRASQTNHFMQTAISGQAELVKEKVILDRQNMVNGFQNQVTKDPTALEYVLEQYEMANHQFIANGGDRKTLLEMQQRDLPSLYQAQVLGEMRQNTTLTLDKLKSGHWGDKLSAQQVEALTSHVREYKSAKDRDAAFEKAQLKEKHTEDVNKRVSGYLDAHYSGAGFTNKQIADDPLLKDSPAQKDHLYRLNEAKSKGHFESDTAVVSQVFSDIKDGIISEESQLDAYFIKRQINIADLNWLRGEFQGTRTSEGKQILRSEKDAIIAFEKTNRGDPEEGQLGNDFKRYLSDEKVRLRKEHIPVMNLFVKGNKDYIFRDGLKPRSPSQRAKAYMNQFRQTDAGSSLDTGPGTGAATGALTQKPPSAPPPIVGFTPLMAEYNRLVSPSDAFSSEGTPPAKYSKSALVEAQKNLARKEGFAEKYKSYEAKIADAPALNKAKNASIEQKRWEEQAALAETFGVPPPPSPDQKNKAAEQGALKKLGLESIAPSVPQDVDPKRKRQGNESIEQWKKRLEGKK